MLVATALVETACGLLGRQCRSWVQIHRICQVALGWLLQNLDFEWLAAWFFASAKLSLDELRGRRGRNSTIFL